MDREWPSARFVGHPRRTPIERKPDQATTPGAPKRRSPSGNRQGRHRGTPVETYLASRGICICRALDALRFHAGLKHPSGGIWPAMVALVTSGVDGTPLAIHRTFLARDGGGKRRVDPGR